MKSSLKLGAHRQITLSFIWHSRFLNGSATKNSCVRMTAEHYSSLCHMAQPYSKYQISLILSPYLAQRYLAQPRILAVCDCLRLMAQPFVGKSNHLRFLHHMICKMAASSTNTECFPEEKDEALVELWRGYDTLYNTDHPRFKDRTHRAKIIQEIAKQLGETGKLSYKPKVFISFLF